MNNAILVFGPDQMGAELKIKKFTKDICKKLNIATAAYDVFDNYDDVRIFVKPILSFVIKADGLAAGKELLFVKQWKMQKMH